MPKCLDEQDHEDRERDKIAERLVNLESQLFEQMARHQFLIESCKKHSAHVKRLEEFIRQYCRDTHNVQGYLDAIQKEIWGE